MIVDVVVDGTGVLHGLASAHELGLAVRIEAAEAADRGFGDHQAGVVDAEIVVTGDDAGEAVHDEVVAVSGNDVEDDASSASHRQ